MPIVLLHDRLLTFNTQQVVWLFVFLVWRHYFQIKQIIECALSDVFFLFLFFDLPQYSNRFDYIRDRRRAIYFNNQKNHCISSLRAWLWSTDGWAHAMWLKNLRRVVRMTCVRCEWWLVQALHEMHNMHHRHHWSNASRLLASCWVGDHVSALYRTKMLKHITIYNRTSKEGRCITCITTTK